MFHLDGVLFKNTFGTAEMRKIFKEEAFIQTFLETEAALARAEARMDLIPEAAAEEITEKATLDYLDLNQVEQNVAEIDLFTMAIIKAWKEKIGETGEYIHWGATSQDISDTAVILQIREGFEIIQRDLLEIRTFLEDHTEEYADVPMIGRTHHVHAIPITFGLKTATWLDELNRHIERFDELAERLFVVEFFGATGTLASLGEDGTEIQELFADELDLNVPDVAWYASRDRFAELVSAMAAAASTLGKIASQVLLLNRPEFGEVSESIGEGKIGSSTMPHKKNPTKSEGVVALAKMLRAHAHLAQELMEGNDERDAATWIVEFALIPETFCYFGSSLENTKTVLSDLEVHEDGLTENLHHYGSLVTSEAIMMELADELGRQTAHEVVSEHAMTAIEEDRDFKTLLRTDERVNNAISENRLTEISDPAAYTGLSGDLARQAVESSRQDTAKRRERND